MARLTRTQLHEKLLQICPNCYFQPPTTIKMTYPCIVYNRSNIESTFANNEKYQNDTQYMLTVIDRNPDSTIPTEVLNSFTMSEFNNGFVQDNLNHSVLVLYT